jgi:hypothetical protein
MILKWYEFCTIINIINSVTFFHARFVLRPHVQLGSIRILQENERRVMNAGTRPSHALVQMSRHIFFGKVIYILNSIVSCAMIVKWWIWGCAGREGWLRVYSRWWSMVDRRWANCSGLWQSKYQVLLRSTYLCSLTGEMAVNVINRQSAVVSFVCLLNDLFSLY